MALGVNGRALDLAWWNRGCHSSRCETRYWKPSRLQTDIETTRYNITVEDSYAT